MKNSSTMNAVARTLGVFVLSALPVLFTGCASIVHGGSRTISVNSTPSGAKVTIEKADTQYPVDTGTTPLTVSLDPHRGYFKGQSYTVIIQLDGYKTARVDVSPTVSGWYVGGNLVFGGLIGYLIVDPITGSMWNLSPDNIEQTLSPGQASLIKSHNGFKVVLLSDTNLSQRASMVRIN